MAAKIDLTIIAPMYNEAENVASTVARIKDAFKDFPGAWELVMVDDGSTDSTRALADAEAAGDPRIRVTGYTPNAGRGRALRTGFAAARGRVIATVDFDLSYSPGHVIRMYDALRDNPDADIVLASAYMPGGEVAGVPLARLAASRIANIFMRQVYRRRWHTLTCIVRAYRREAIQSLDLTSDGKEIHLEILSKALDRGLRILEIPARLECRKLGHSKFRLGKTVLTHLRMAFAERPMVFLAPGGVLLLLLGVALYWRWPWVSAGLVLVGWALIVTGYILTRLAELRRERRRCKS